MDLKNYLFLAAFIILLTSPFTISAQQQAPEKCFTVQNQLNQQQRYPDEMPSDEDFEKWMADEIAKLPPVAERAATYTLPIVFHVIHDNEAVGSGDNKAAIWIQRQIDQLNIDFADLAGSTNGASADTEIQFCAAQVDPNGNPLAEPGINRIDRNTQGWTAPPYGTCTGTSFGNTYIQNTIKPSSQWDPNNYINIWVMDLVCGVLGYAQFPSNSGLGGLNTSGGAATRDGVVILPGTLGSRANPQSAGQGGTLPYNGGRTLTHELGHFFGLRHIWGDSNCGNDFCADTPTQQTSTGGNCPSTTTCDGVADMTRNYMDYSNDACMNIFTQDQADRMAVVMGVSPRRAPLSLSTACGTTSTCGSMVNLTGNQSGTFDQESGDWIKSTQVIQGGASVDYDADPTGGYIWLDNGFCAPANANFNAFIDGCNSGAGGVNLRTGEILR